MFSVPLIDILRDRNRLYDRIMSGDKLFSTIVSIFIISVIFLALYGFFMGMYHSFAQAISSAIKLPVLFYLSLIICYPAMFVYNAILGSKMTFIQSFAMILSTFAFISCVLISFIPIVVFFHIIDSSYSFMKFMHVGILGISGIAGMIVLVNGLIYACDHHKVYPRKGITLVQIWILIFAFVGTQLGWNLKPFIGAHEYQFQLFRHAKGNIYISLIKSLGDFVDKIE